MSNTEENLAAVERELAADVAMAEGRADAEDATLPEPAAGFIYLDYAATAPLCAEAAGAMAPFQVPGPANLAVNANANALYGVGRAAFDLLESARRPAAQALGARRPDRARGRKTGADLRFHADVCLRRRDQGEFSGDGEYHDRMSGKKYTLHLQKM